MAKTDAELLEYFKTVTNRNDWTLEDFMSARRECHDGFEQITFLINSAAYISTVSDDQLSAIQIVINQIRNAIVEEISRRNS